MTTVAISPTPIQQFFDNRGQPAAGGYVLTQVGGTNYPTYQDAAGTIPLPNPIPLNSRGEISNASGISCELFLDSSATYVFTLFDANGNQLNQASSVAAPASAAALAAYEALMASISGAAQVGYKRTAISGAVASTLQKLADALELNLVADFGADPTGVADSSAAVQAWVNACSSANLFSAPNGYAPAGTYKVSQTINFPSKYVHLRGAGEFATVFKCDTVVGSVFKVAAIQYWSPKLCDFAIIDSTLTTTGSAIDTSALTPYGSAQMYNFEFRNLYLYTKATSLLCYSAFAGKFDSCLFNSSAGNSVTVSCGPGVTWINSYASIAGAGKCAWRLAGLISMINCNGMDAGDRWGVFGQDPTASDGYQNDFPSAGNDYPDVTLINCNVEHFAVNGITLHNQFRNFRFTAGKLDRNYSSTAYESIIKARLGPLSNAPIYLSPGYVFPGTGVPNGGAALTNAWLYAASGQPIFVDENGALNSAGITGFYSTVYGGLVPNATQQAINDVFQGSATQFNAIRSVRISAGIVRYNTGSTITPVGTNQAIDVTSREKVTVTPAAAASVSTATFDTTTGAGTDFGRNGSLLIEAGNGNLTIVHSASGNSTFRMAGGTNVTMAAGQILRFCFSVTSNQWIQV